MTKTTITPEFNVPKTVDDILAVLTRDRERQIISGRFGLTGHKQTLEEIGRELGITRERVRQIEKQVITRLPELKHPHFEKIKRIFSTHLEELGRVAPIRELAGRLGLDNQAGFAQVSFLAHILPDFVVLSDSDHWHPSVGLAIHHDEDQLHKLGRELIETLRRMAKPAKLADIQANMPSQLELEHIHGLARASKGVVNLDHHWGLVSNPLVNPKSIRDKIYVILSKEAKPMHFSAIAEQIRDSQFKRRNVTTQAIHNELIKDERFVLVGRGIYALKEWGYSKGTVADVITTILKREQPLHRDEIVRRVLEARQVKPTTIILNLQGKAQFKRVAKATYGLSG